MGIELCLFEEGFSLKLFKWFISLRFLDRWRREPHEIMESWGVSVYPREHYVAFHWGRYYMHWQPFGDWHHVRNEVMQPDGKMVPVKETWTLKDGEEGDGRWQEKHPYHYCLRNWTIQEVVATIWVEEREWRWRLFSKFILPWPRKIHRYIEVSFSDEVGERSGSWKGGTIGCGFDLRPDETPVECLRRMERDRKF